MTNLPLNTSQQADLEAWRATALTRMPYMANVLFALRPVNKPGLGTFAVDNQMRLYIDFDATAGWSDDLKAQALLHECSHILQGHSDQFKDLGLTASDNKLFNVAADAAINDDLRDAGCKELCEMGVTPDSFGAPDYLTPGEYFEYLRRITPPQAPSKPQPQPGGSGEGASGEGDSEPSDDFEGCGSGAGGQEVPDPIGDGDVDGTAPAASQSEIERTRIITANDIRDAHAKGRGNVPAGLVGWADAQFTPSVTPWQKVLGRKMRSAVRTVAGQTDTSFQRRSARRHNERVLGTNNRVVHAGNVEYRPSLVVIRDTSGSMGDADLTAVTREVDAISKRLRVRGADLMIVDVDAKVAGARQYNGARSMNEFFGRGGTNMSVGIEHAMTMKPRPTAVVVLTDGDTPWPAKQLSRKVPVIACIIADDDSGLARVPKWISALHVQPEGAK